MGFSGLKLTIAAIVPAILAVHGILAHAAITVGQIGIGIRPLAHTLLELRVVTPVVPVPVAVVIVIVVMLVVALIPQVHCAVASFPACLWEVAALHVWSTNGDRSSCQDRYHERLGVHLGGRTANEKGEHRQWYNNSLKERRSPARRSRSYTSTLFPFHDTACRAMSTFRFALDSGLLQHHCFSRVRQLSRVTKHTRTTRITRNSHRLSMPPCFRCCKRPTATTSPSSAQSTHWRRTDS